MIVVHCYTILLLLTLEVHVKSQTEASKGNYGFQPPRNSFNRGRSSQVVLLYAPTHGPAPDTTKDRIFISTPSPDFPGQSEPSISASGCENIRFLDRGLTCQVPNARFPIRGSCKDYVRCSSQHKSGTLGQLNLSCSKGQIFSIFSNKCEDERFLPFNENDCPQLKCDKDETVPSVIVNNPGSTISPFRPNIPEFSEPKYAGPVLPFCPPGFGPFTRPCRPKHQLPFAGHKVPPPPVLPFPGKGFPDHTTVKDVFPSTYEIDTSASRVAIPYVPPKFKPTTESTWHFPKSSTWKYPGVTYEDRHKQNEPETPPEEKFHLNDRKLHQQPRLPNKPSHDGYHTTEQVPIESWTSTHINDGEETGPEDYPYEDKHVTIPEASPARRRNSWRRNSASRLQNITFCEAKLFLLYISTAFIAKFYLM